MKKYVRKHEAFIKEAIVQETVDADLIKYHEKRIEWLAHERMVHLMVFLFTLASLITFFVLAYLLGNVWFYCITLLLLVVSVFYMGHYYFLENSIQRWYEYADQMSEKYKHRNQID